MNTPSREVAVMANSQTEKRVNCEVKPRMAPATIPYAAKLSPIPSSKCSCSMR